MAVTQATERENVCQLIEEYADDPYCLELIQFFGWHPSTRFSGLAILHALNVNSERCYIERAMRQLIDKGVVRAYSDNNVHYYCLTNDESFRQAAVDIVRLDWSQWQALLRRSHVHIRSNMEEQPLVLLNTITNP
jgi:hypothetical protein